MLKGYKYEENLETSRLKTRWLVAEDHVRWTSFLANKKATQFFPDYLTDQPAERAKEWIKRQLNRYAENKFGLQALIDKQTGAFIGQCGLLLQEIDGVSELEVGYHILPEYWGRGYAPEAASGFMHYAMINQLSDSIISIIHHQNTNSMRVAEKNGLKPDKQTKWNDLDVVIYRTKF